MLQKGNVLQNICTSARSQLIVLTPIQTIIATLQITLQNSKKTSASNYLLALILHSTFLNLAALHMQKLACLQLHTGCPKSHAPTLERYISIPDGLDPRGI